MALKQQHKTRWHGHKRHKMGLIVSGLGNPVMATLRQISLIKNPASVTLLWAVQSVFMVFPTFTGKSCIWKAKSLYGLVPQETFFQCVNSIISQAIVSKVKSLKRIGAQLQMKKNQPVNLKKTTLHIMFPPPVWICIELNKLSNFMQTAKNSSPQ